MKNTLLGIKVIGWLCVISGIFAGMAIFWQEDYAVLGITFLLNLIIGINLLRRKEAARKFMVFLTALSIAAALIAALLVPNLILDRAEKYRQKMHRYKEISAKISELQKEKPVDEYELVPLTVEAKSLKIFLDRYPEYEKAMGKIYKNTFELNMANIIGISYMMFIVYYLTRPYVKEKFKENA
ncbi:MAG: hypothetical protein PHR22_02030 [Candidatus Omnitrophica bacterium]|nr:hypothetical protein [Candidatus Omnitrophota bacterium]